MCLDSEKYAVFVKFYSLFLFVKEVSLKKAHKYVKYNAMRIAKVEHQNKHRILQINS